MKNLVNDIIKGKNLEIALPQYGRNMMTLYYRYSAVRFAMNYYTYNDKLEEKNGEGGNGEGKIQLRKLVRSYLNIVENAVMKQSAGPELEEAVRSIDIIRNDVIKTMKGLTSLVDILNIYEYVLNRVEYRFKDKSGVNVKDDESFTREIMQYMLAGDDKALINLKITECIRQLPVRMAKSRFFELLLEGLKVYKDSEKTTVDDFVYMLSSSSMIYTDDYASQISAALNDIIAKFDKTDFGNMDESGYNELKDMLTYAIDYVQTAVDEYMMLAELVNDVYVLLLSAPYISEADEEREILLSILSNADDESVEAALVRLEGKQEMLSEQFAPYEYLVKEILDTKKDMVESLMLEAVYNSLDMITGLESGSYFVEFDRVYNHEIAGEEYVLGTYEIIKDELLKYFKGHNKLVNRAVMAHVLASLPVFFNNVEQIQEYVYSSITGCSDEAEKTACAEIFASMMEEDGFNVVS